MKKSSKSEVIGGCGGCLFIALLPVLSITAVEVAVSAIQGEAVFTNPPIELSVTRNTSNEKCLTVHNKSNKRISCTLTLTSPPSIPKESFWIVPRGYEHIGFGLFSYDYEAGDCGYIEVKGYSRKLYFRLGKNDDTVGFGWFGRWW